MTTLQLPPFSYWQIPPLVIATTFTFGGLMGAWKPARAMREYGLPPSFHNQRDVGIVWGVYGTRMTWVGLLIYIFYARGDLRSINTIFSTMFVCGFSDGWACYQAGVPGTALWRFTAGLLLSAFGYFEMASW